MQKIETIKVKNEDGTLSNEGYYFSVNANNVDMFNGESVQSNIGNIDLNHEKNIAEQLKNIKTKITNLEVGLNNSLNKVDIVNNLNSTSKDKVLSAAQGNILNKKLNLLSNKKIKFVENIIEGIPQKVLFTGDSITFGQIPSETTAVVNPFPKLIETFIRDWYEDSNIITCVNYGVRGAISTNATDNFDNYLEENPNTIFWAYGTNDVTQLRDNNTILQSLEEFYDKCLDNNIELIVIIPGPNFINEARNQGMRRLHDALLQYCEANCITYIDMFKYINNLYETNATTHLELQRDGTHFDDYSCFRDAIISELFPIIYKQIDNKYNYIRVEKTPKYVKTNIGAVTVGTTINIFNQGLRVTSSENNIFKMNILVTKPSYLILNGYKNTTAGKATFKIDNNTYEVDEHSTYSGTTSVNAIMNYKFPILLNSGLHKIELTNIELEEGENRYYIYGFILKESDENKSITGYLHELNLIEAWSGNETSLTDTFLNIDLKTVNEIQILLGSGGTGNSFQNIKINPVIPVRKFYENNTFTMPVVWNNTVGIATIITNITNNTISFSSNNNIPIRYIYCYNNVSFKNEGLPKTEVL